MTFDLKKIGDLPLFAQAMVMNKQAVRVSPAYIDSLRAKQQGQGIVFSGTSKAQVEETRRKVLKTYAALVVKKAARGTWFEIKALSANKFRLTKKAGLS